MNREKGSVIQATSELKGITNELNVIDYLRKQLRYEYDEIFTKELEEKMAEAKDYYYKEDAWDIRRYTLFVLKFFMEERFGIDMYYIWLENMKIILLFENVLTTLLEDEPKYIEINRKIFDMKRIYLLFRALISKKVLNVEMHKKALEQIGMSSLNQDKIDNDENGFYKDFLSRQIAEKKLLPFFDEYITLLSGT